MLSKIELIAEDVRFEDLNRKTVQDRTLFDDLFYSASISDKYILTIMKRLRVHFTKDMFLSLGIGLGGNGNTLATAVLYLAKNGQPQLFQFFWDHLDIQITDLLSNKQFLEMLDKLYNTDPFNQIFESLIEKGTQKEWIMLFEESCSPNLLNALSHKFKDHLEIEFADLIQHHLNFLIEVDEKHNTEPYNQIFANLVSKATVDDLIQLWKSTYLTSNLCIALLQKFYAQVKMEDLPKRNRKAVQAAIENLMDQYDGFVSDSMRQKIDRFIDDIEFEDLEKRAQNDYPLLAVLVRMAFTDDRHLVRILERFRENITKDFYLNSDLSHSYDNEQQYLMNEVLDLATQENRTRPLMLFWQYLDIQIEDLLHEDNQDFLAEIDSRYNEMPFNSIFDKLVAKGSPAELMHLCSQSKKFPNIFEALFDKLKDKITLEELLFEKIMDGGCPLVDLVKSDEGDSVDYILGNIYGFIPTTLGSQYSKLIKSRNDFFTFFEEVKGQPFVEDRPFNLLLTKAQAAQKEGYLNACYEVGVYFQSRDLKKACQSFSGVPKSHPKFQEVCIESSQLEFGLALSQEKYLLPRIGHLMNALKFALRIQDEGIRHNRIQEIAASYIGDRKPTTALDLVSTDWLEAISLSKDIHWAFKRFDDIKEKLKLEKKINKYKLAPKTDSTSDQNLWLARLDATLKQPDDAVRYEQMQGITAEFVGSAQPNLLPVEWFELMHEPIEPLWCFRRLQEIKNIEDMKKEIQLVKATHSA